MPHRGRENRIQIMPHVNPTNESPWHGTLSSHKWIPFPSLYLGLPTFNSYKTNQKKKKFHFRGIQVIIASNSLIHSSLKANILHSRYEGKTKPSTKRHVTNAANPAICHIRSDISSTISWKISPVWSSSERGIELYRAPKNILEKVVYTHIYIVVSGQPYNNKACFVI